LVSFALLGLDILNKNSIVLCQNFNSGSVDHTQLYSLGAL
jgi:hypothetical protein